MTNASLRLAPLLALALAGACQKDNPGFCGDDCPVDADVIDAAVGCDDDPGLCGADETCFQDTCVDCEAGNDLQSPQCTDPVAPVCGANRDCRACAADSECDSQLCDGGSCAAAGTVLFVRPDGDDDGGNSTCTDAAAPCRTIVHAMSRVPTTGGTPAANRRYLKLLARGTYAESAAVVIDDKTVVIVGAPIVGGERSVIDRTNNNVTVDIKGGSDVRLERVSVANGTGSAAHGISCTEDSTLVANGIETTNHTGLGVSSMACDLTLRDSVVTGNDVGGVSAQNGRIVIVNNVIVDNGGTMSEFGGLRIGLGTTPTSVIQSNTIVSNAGTPSDGVTCLIPSLAVMNNIVFGNGLKPRISGTCVFDHTLYGPDDPGGLLGTANGNELVPMLSSFMFVSATDYHIASNSVAKGKGTTTGQATEALRDMDGQPRPQGAPDVGADEIPD